MLIFKQLRIHDVFITYEHVTLFMLNGSLHVNGSVFEVSFKKKLERLTKFSIQKLKGWLKSSPFMVNSDDCPYPFSIYHLQNYFQFLV